MHRKFVSVPDFQLTQLAQWLKAVHGAFLVIWGFFHENILVSNPHLYSMYLYFLKTMLDFAMHFIVEIERYCLGWGFIHGVGYLETRAWKYSYLKDALIICLNTSLLVLVIHDIQQIALLVVFKALFVLCTVCYTGNYRNLIRGKSVSLLLLHLRVVWTLTPSVSMSLSR